MKKFLLAFAAAFALCVTAFADNEIYFTAIDGSYTANQMHVDITSSDDGCYFYIKQNSTVGQVVVISETSGNHFSYSGTLSSGGSDSGSNIAINTAFGDYYIGYGPPTVQPADLSALTTSGNAAIIPASTTNAEIQQMFADYLANPPTPEPSVISTFSIPRGNVAYFQVAAAGDVNFTSYMSQLSFLVQFGENQYGPWGDTGQRYGPAASLPSAGTTFPLLSQDPIRWFKDPKQNVLGQTKIGKSTKSCIVGQWYAFYNPDISQIAHEATSDIAGASVTVQGSFSQVKVYPLSERLDYSGVGGTFSSYSDDDYASYYDGNIGEDGTITWTDQSGDLNAPSAGGQNAQYGDLSTEGLLETMRNTLNRIFEEIKSLFTFGYEAVQTLVGIFSDFVASLGQLYTWLPSEVYSALMSAVIVAIVIGVFKVFL